MNSYSEAALMILCKVDLTYEWLSGRLSLRKAFDKLFEWLFPRTILSGSCDD